MERALRLRDGQDFQRVYRNSTVQFYHAWKLFGKKNHRSTNRYGFSVSKKFGRAHERNRMKRRLRAWVFHHQQDFLPGFDYVFIPKAECKMLSTEEFDQELTHLLQGWKKRQNAYVAKRRG